MIKEDVQGSKNDYELHLKGWRTGFNVEYVLR